MTGRIFLIRCARDDIIDDAECIERRCVLSTVISLRDVLRWDVRTYFSALYIRRRKYRSVYLPLSHREYLYSICQTPRYLSPEHICISGIVKQMQIRRYYRASVSRRRAKRIKYLTPSGWCRQTIQRQYTCLINSTSLSYSLTKAEQSFL